MCGCNRAARNSHCDQDPSISCVAQATTSLSLSGAKIVEAAGYTVYQQVGQVHLSVAATPRLSTVGTSSGHSSGSTHATNMDMRQPVRHERLFSLQVTQGRCHVGQAEHQEWHVDEPTQAAAGQDDSAPFVGAAPNGRDLLIAAAQGNVAVQAEVLTVNGMVSQSTQRQSRVFPARQTNPAPLCVAPAAAVHRIGCAGLPPQTPIPIPLSFVCGVGSSRCGSLGGDC